MHADTRQIDGSRITITPAAVAAARAVLADAFKHNVFKDKPAAGEEILQKMLPATANGVGAGISTLGELSEAISSGRKPLSRYYSGHALRERERALSRVQLIAVTVAAEVDGITLLLYPNYSLS